MKLDIQGHSGCDIVIVHEDNELFIRCFVMSIKFTDGTKIERPTKLPEPT